VTLPEVAVAIMPRLGFRVVNYKGVGPLIASGWARWSSRWFPGTPLLLLIGGDGCPGGHVVIARDGLLYDNGNPDGLTGLDHPCASAIVRCVLRLYVDGDERVDPRRWVVVSRRLGDEAGVECVSGLADAFLDV
jgi:hypothetical protein